MKRTALATLIFAHTIYGQTPGTFYPTGSMNISRAAHTATLLNNGTVLIAGGTEGINQATATAEIYDPGTGTFTPTGSMSTARYWHSATLLPDGRVLIAGGEVAAPQTKGTNSAEIYDPETGTFTATAPMLSGHICQQSVLLNNGQVLLVGGANGNGEVGDNHPELYDPVTRTFSSAGLAPAQDDNTCQGVAASALASGKVLLVWEDSHSQIYDPATQTFTTTGAANPTAYNDGLPSSTLLMDGSVLVAGGYWDGGVYRTAYTFDEAPGLFTATGEMSTGHVAHATALLPDGSVLLSGGCSGSFNQIAGSDLYDPASRTFSRGADMLTPRCEHTATLLKDGQVLLTGGYVGYPYITTAAAEIYNPAALIPGPVLYTGPGAPNQGAVLHAGGARLVTANDPALPGETIEIYGAGLREGAVIPPQVSIGGRAAQVLFFGDAPGFPGVNQINAVVPSGIAAGGLVPVFLNYVGRSSNAVTIGVSD